jgi:hypothetical protein
LTRRECLDRLGSSSLGHVAFNADALPCLATAPYVFDGDRIVFAVRADPRVMRGLDDTVVAFQVDHESDEDAWRVLVRGRSLVHEATDPGVDVSQLGLPLLCKGPDRRCVSLQIDLIEGTRRSVRDRPRGELVGAR